MRHRVFGKKLNRDVKERKALFKSLIFALIKHGKIKTTLAKAKAIKGLIERLVTYARDGGDNARRQLASFLTRKEAVDKLISEVAPRFKDRVGGYIRMIKLGRRISDSSEEVVLTWSVEEESSKLKSQSSKKTKDAKDTSDGGRLIPLSGRSHDSSEVEELE